MMSSVFRFRWYCRFLTGYIEYRITEHRRFDFIFAGTSRRHHFGTVEYMQSGRGTVGTTTVFEIRRDADGDAAIAVARPGRGFPGAARPGDGHETADGTSETAAEQRPQVRFRVEVSAANASSPVDALASAATATDAATATAQEFTTFAAQPAVRIRQAARGSAAVAAPTTGHQQFVQRGGFAAGRKSDQQRVTAKQTQEHATVRL